MSFTIDTQSLIAAGVGVSLLGSLARALFHTPKQTAQINAIEGKLDLVLNQVASTLPAQIASTLPNGFQPNGFQQKVGA